MRRVFFLCLVLFTLNLPAADFSSRFEEIKRTATPAQLYTLLYALPKGGDLHNHMGGAIRSEWWFKVATDPRLNGNDVFYTRIHFKAGLDTGLPLVLFQTIRRYAYEHLSVAEKEDYVRLDQLTPEQKTAWLDSLRLDRPGEGREEFFSWIWPRTGQLHSNLSVACEVIAETVKAYGAEGLRYLETQQSAFGFVDNTGVPIAPETAAEVLRKRLREPDLANSGMTVRFQLTVLRFSPNAERNLEKYYEFAAANRDLWVGLNFAGIEENGKGYPARFLETLRGLRRRFPSVALSIHAGEMDGPDQHIRDTLLLGASRIGHGVNLIKDPETLLLLQQTRRVLVEINLISNRLLEYTPDLSTHPFPEYLRTGVPVCLNTDDRGMWDSNMTDEYFTAVTTFNLSWEEVVLLGRNSLSYSFAQPETKAKLLAEYDAAVVAFAARFAPANSLETLKTASPVTYGYAKRQWAFPFAQ